MTGEAPSSIFGREPGDIESAVDKGLRHKLGVEPREYLKHWLSVSRQFGYATHDDSWGEFDKEFAIIIRRLVIAERTLAAARTRDAQGGERGEEASDEDLASTYTHFGSHRLASLDLRGILANAGLRIVRDRKE